MNCEEARALMDRLLADDIDMQEMQALWEHAGRCAACKMEIEKVSRLVHALEYRPEADPPEYLVKRIMSAIEPESPPKKGFLPDAIQTLFAALVLALVGSLYPLWQKFTVQNILTRLYFKTVEYGLNAVAKLAQRIAEMFGQAGLFVIAVAALISAIAVVELTLRLAHRSE